MKYGAVVPAPQGRQETNHCRMRKPSRQAHHRLVFRTAQSAHQINNEDDEEDQAKSAAANHGTADIKAAATEQKNKKQDKKYWIHEGNVTRPWPRRYGAFTPMQRKSK